MTTATAVSAPVLETVETTHWVLAEKLDKLTKAVAALAKRATKRGVAAPTLRVGRFEMRRVDAIDDVTGERAESLARFAEVVVAGGVPRLNGWRFVATLHHMDGATIALGANCEVPEGTVERGPDCEHCAVKRQRRDTYLLQHDDGAWKQVGSTCLTAFFGDASAEKLAAAAEYLGEVEGLARGGSCGEMHRSTGWSLLAFLMQTAAAVREHGWMSKGEAYEKRLTATASRAVEEMELGDWHAKHGPGHAALVAMREPVKPMLCDAVAAQGAIDWCLERDMDAVPADDDYARTLRMIAQVGRVDRRTAGLAASMLMAAKRAVERAERAKAMAARAARDASSVYFGEVGKRGEFELTVEFVKELDSDYGTKHLVVLRDAAGNAASWFSTNGGLEQGKRVLAKATVKSHAEYRGVKQTMLTRVAVVKELEVAR